MRLGVVGVGGAGGRITAAIRTTERRTGRSITDGHVLVFDTDRSALETLDAIPTDRRVPIGHTVEGVAGTGVDGDPELGSQVVQEDDYEIQRSFDDMPIEDLDGLLIVAGFAGGTGGGAGAAILAMCQELFEFPVYALGVLPDAEMSDAEAVTCARAFQSFVRSADNVFTFDNETWGTDDTFDEANEEIAEQVVRLLSLGEFDGSPAEARVDRTDIIRTLSTGGVSSIGMATWSLDLGWRRWFRWLPGVGLPPRDATTDAQRLNQLVKQAIESPLSLPCDVTSTERALVVTAGPQDVLSRKGFESARHWLEQEIETVELIAGDEPRPGSNAVRTIVLLSNVTDVPRIEAIKERGVAAVESTGE